MLVKNHFYVAMFTLIQLAGTSTSTSDPTTDLSTFTSTSDFSSTASSSSPAPFTTSSAYQENTSTSTTTLTITPTSTESGNSVSHSTKTGESYKSTPPNTFVSSAETTINYSLQSTKTGESHTFTPPNTSVSTSSPLIGNNDLAIGLGVGIPLGVIALAAVIGAIVFALRRKRKIVDTHKVEYSGIEESSNDPTPYMNASEFAKATYDNANGFKDSEESTYDITQTAEDGGLQYADIDFIGRNLGQSRSSQMNYANLDFSSYGNRKTMVPSGSNINLKR